MNQPVKMLMVQGHPTARAIVWPQTPSDPPLTPDEHFMLAQNGEIERLTDDYAAATHLLADRDAQIERLMAELATLRASAASVQADQRAEIDAAKRGWRDAKTGEAA